METPIKHMDDLGGFYTPILETPNPPVTTRMTSDKI